ncbi:MAG: cysteine--tRNA ligase [Anaerovibrio sp.]|uniref:cysteine--tRNA ligase n=1 Tax=Anaerovibrio sp. TaxID=1872532 RepID=UPI0025F013CB|nr:cysteine--tRNA ligase [Anaerovibrio sp.]MCR5176455.1 cysteine--tRNA ligase [Anaerovibrio sp.]
MLKVYNTLTRKKEEFVPQEPGKVGMYVCGVTPYNYPHIGNARPFVTWDVIKRYLKHRGFEVKHIQNFTDMDDKIIKAANSEKVSWQVITDRYIDGYFKAIDALNVQRADIYPKVTEHIDDIISMVQKIIDNGYAYVVDGDVYFSVEKFPQYGKLSGRKLEDMLAGARVEVDTRKHNPMDFALWKSAKPDEPYWESPWGKGRPGWHIECSTMSLKYLGETFDFHGGGSDLIFPHHENEIAQSQCCCGDFHSFAQYWLHNGFITIDNEKMSKSLNNFITVPDILKQYPGEVVRFFILRTHYRSPLDFSEDRIKEAQAGLMRLKNAYDLGSELLGREGTTEKHTNLSDIAQSAMNDFYEAMDDDFNTALAIGYMFTLSKEINVYANNVINKGAEYDAVHFARLMDVYGKMADVIGIFEGSLEMPADASSEGISTAEIEALISERAEAKKNKNWARADEIRDDLKAKGIVLEDSAAGTKWKKA